MADALYKKGEFKINNEENGTINQLEGRFSFINQLDYYNNINYNKKKKRNSLTLNSKEKQYQKFLFYKYFFFNSKPLVITEGKTDVLYLKAALKKYYMKYPDLISKNSDRFEFHISFLKRTKRLKYLLNIQEHGANTMKNIYNFYSGKNSLYEYFLEKTSLKQKNPVILLFDNEQEKDSPLRDFKNHIKRKEKVGEYRNGRMSYYMNIVSDSLFLLTHQLPGKEKNCEIEDLFDKETLSVIIGGKKFSKKCNSDEDKDCYGKHIFSKYVLNNYASINFENFTSILDDLNMIIENFKKSRQ